MPGPREAFEALGAFARTEPAAAKELLGPEVDCPTATRTLAILRESLGADSRVERVLELAGNRIREEWPESSPQRRAALLTLMVARGTARSHVPVHFDRTSLLAILR